VEESKHRPSADTPTETDPDTLHGSVGKAAHKQTLRIIHKHLLNYGRTLRRSRWSGRH